VVTLANDVKVRLEIWDTAGQERYQSISQMFYRDAKVALICYEQSTADTIEQWTRQLKNFVTECILILVSTKIDLLSRDQINACQQWGREKAAALGARMHVLTSARTGEGVKALFSSAAQCHTDIYTPAIVPKRLVPTDGIRNCC
jgi:small GTP-binding protein